MPRHEPEVAARVGQTPERYDANQLAKRIMDLATGQTVSDIMLALGYVTARAFVKSPTSYHERMKDDFGAGFDCGTKRGQ